jgi:hypothetical protein
MSSDKKERATYRSGTSRPIAHLPGHTDERNLARELGQSLSTLRSWRARGLGPPWLKVGHQVLYPDAERHEWLRKQVIQPVREETVAA